MEFGGLKIRPYYCTVQTTPMKLKVRITMIIRVPKLRLEEHKPSSSPTQTIHLRYHETASTKLPPLRPIKPLSSTHYPPTLSKSYDSTASWSRVSKKM
jgi:hypothetical protein